MPGFLSNSSIALSVFKIENPAAVTGEKLRKYAFRSIDNLNAETKAHGWTSIEDMLDVDWQFSAPEKGQFLCFSLRVDTRKISQPVPVTVDVAFDTQSGLLYVGSTSTAHQELVAELFMQSFGQEPQPTLTLVDVPRILQELYGTSRGIPFGEHTYTLAEAGQLTLAAGDGEVSVKNEPTSAQSGMEAGLSICKLKLEMTRVGEEDLAWQFILHSNLSFSSLKTPKVEKQSNDNADAAILAKLYLIEQAVGVIHTLFEIR